MQNACDRRTRPDSLPIKAAHRVSARPVGSRSMQGVPFHRLPAAIQMVDVHLPTTDGRRLVLPRHNRPNKERELLLHQLGMTLPQQPAPRICA